MPFSPTENINNGGLPNLLKVYIQRALEECVKEETGKVVESVKERIKARMPDIVMAIFDSYSVSWEGQHTLCIKVEIKEPK